MRIFRLIILLAIALAAAPLDLAAAQAPVKIRAGLAYSALVSQTGGHRAPRQVLHF